MSINPPPTNLETITIFNPAYFEDAANNFITASYANGHYLKFPTAQGNETTNFNLTVNGILTQNGIANLNNTSTINGSLIANGTTNLNQLTYIKKPLDMTGDGTLPNYTSSIKSSIYGFRDLTTGLITTPTISNNNNYLILDNSINDSRIQFLTKTSLGVATNNFIIGPDLSIFYTPFNFNSTTPPTSNQIIPSPLDSSNKIPTTAWVQSVIPPPTGKTYTVKYTTSQTIQLPVNCCGISVIAVGQGGASGNASNSSVVGLWNAGGSGSAGTTITSNGILPFKEGSSMDIIISPLFGSELYANTVGATVCRANNGVAGGNASFGAGGIAGVSNNTWIVNNAMTSWNVQIGPSGPAGGSNLAFQTATYPATGGIPICNNWVPSVIHGCGQNWNGITTTNSFQGPAIGILGGAIWITYYLT